MLNMGRMTFDGGLRRLGGLWKDILRESSRVKENWKFCIGHGTRIRFWMNHWCGNLALSISYPTLFESIVNKLEIMGKIWDQTVGNGSWKLSFVIKFQ